MIHCGWFYSVSTKIETITYLSELVFRSTLFSFSMMILMLVAALWSPNEPERAAWGLKSVKGKTVLGKGGFPRLGLDYFFGCWGGII